MAARDIHGPKPPWGEHFQVIGQGHRKVDGPAKATGDAIYADDIVLPGMLHAKTLRSPHAHAKIKAIRTDKALALEGVHAVITGSDLPEYYGIIPWTPDENALAVDKVRFIGDEVAAVAGGWMLRPRPAYAAVIRAAADIGPSSASHAFRSFSVVVSVRKETEQCAVSMYAVAKVMSRLRNSAR